MCENTQEDHVIITGVQVPVLLFRECAFSWYRLYGVLINHGLFLKYSSTRACKLNFRFGLNSHFRALSTTLYSEIVVASAILTCEWSFFVVKCVLTRQFYATTNSMHAGTPLTYMAMCKAIIFYFASAKKRL